MQRIVIQVRQLSQRLQYVCDIIFTHYLGVPFSITTESELDSKSISIAYGLTSKDAQHSFLIPSTGLIEQDNIDDINPGFHSDNKLPRLFYMPEAQSDLDFDLFSMVFYLLSRYEEYLVAQPDKYGRFQSTNSLAVKHNFISSPLVDLWIQELCDLLNQKYDTGYRLSDSYRCQPTVDIDLPFAFHLKGWKALLGGLRDLAKLDISTLMSRMSYFITRKDPFDTYSYIKEVVAQNSTGIKFFILNKLQRPLDENHLANTAAMGDLIQSLSSWAEIGIHPSISAGNEPKEIQSELEFVNEHSGSPIYSSRQHFLKLNLPDTYKALIQCGIKHDYSMSYPDQLGFRASTSRSYPWYDLKSESQTELMIHPNVAMDVTLRHYSQLTPDEAIERCQSLNERVRAVNGQFIFIWHNSSLSSAYGWQKWIKVFEALCRM